MSTARTLIDMPAERRCAAGENRAEDFQVPPGEPTAAAIEERVSCGADHIGHLQKWPRHSIRLAGAILASEHRERIQRAGDRAQMPLRNVEVDARLLEVMMSKQQLDGPQIGATLQQVRGEAVAERVRMKLLANTGALGGLTAGAPDDFAGNRSVGRVPSPARE